MIKTFKVIRLLMVFSIEDYIRSPRKSKQVEKRA